MKSATGVSVRVVLLVVSGLPGVGKSAVAVAFAQRVRAAHLSVDAVEDALLGAGLPRGWTTGVAAYEAVRAAAEQSLALGLSVVVDAVNDSEPARDTWRKAAHATRAALWMVLLTAPPESEHRRRLASRTRGLAHVPEPNWANVTARAVAYAPWLEEDLIVLDSGQPLEVVVDQLAAATGTCAQ